MRIECSAPRTARYTTAASASSAPSSSSVEPDPALAGEEQGEQDDRPEVGDRSRRDDQLTERGRDLARVLQHRHDHAERGGAQDDRDKQRRLDKAPGREPETHDHRDPERDREAERGEAQHLPAQALELDLEPREEEHEAEPDQGDDLDRLVHLDDPEHRRADHDPGDDLEHDGRQTHAWEQAEQERCREGHGHDDQQADHVADAVREEQGLRAALDQAFRLTAAARIPRPSPRRDQRRGAVHVAPLGTGGASAGRALQPRRNDPALAPAAPT